MIGTRVGVAARLAVTIAIGATTAIDAANDPKGTIGFLIGIAATSIWLGWAIQRFRQLRSVRRDHAGAHAQRTS